MASRKPIFGTYERVRAHSLEITDILTQVLHAAPTKAGSLEREKFFANRDHGLIRYGDMNDSREFRLVCDLNRHTSRLTERSTTIWAGDRWQEMIEIALDILNRPEDEFSNPDANIETPATAILVNLAWYFEHRAWTKNALANPRAHNHWVRALPKDIRLLMALIRARSAYGRNCTMTQLCNVMPQESPNAIARELSQIASQQGQSLMQFFDGFGSGAPNISTPDGSELKTQITCLKGVFSINLSGFIADDLAYNECEGAIVIKNRYSESAIDGLMSNIKGTPLHKIIDLPWGDKTTTVHSMEEAEDRLIIRLWPYRHDPQGLINISQALPKEVRPLKPVQ